MVRFLVLAGIAAAVGVATGQQPAKPINPAPLEHPQPLTSIRSSDPAAVMAQLRQIATESDFAITRADSGRLTLEARRADPAPSKNYDRVLIWLERSPLDPAVTVDLYLAYGRYEEIIARNGPEIFRVVVSPTYEDQRISALRTRLLALSH
jgi:hypothetical protein